MATISPIKPQHKPFSECDSLTQAKRVMGGCLLGAPYVAYRLIVDCLPPAVQGVQEKTHAMLTYTHESAILPIAQMTQNVASGAMATSHDLGAWVHETILREPIDFLSFYVINPMTETLQKGGSWFTQNLFQPIKNSLQESGDWVYDHALFPFTYAVVDAISNATESCIEMAGSTTKVAYDKAKPTLDASHEMAQTSKDTFNSYVTDPVQSIVLQTHTWGSENISQPILNAMNYVCQLGLEATVHFYEGVKNSLYQVKALSEEHFIEPTDAAVMGCYCSVKELCFG
jgi:hypothetical protein